MAVVSSSAHSEGVSEEEVSQIMAPVLLHGDEFFRPGDLIMKHDKEKPFLRPT